MAKDTNDPEEIHRQFEPDDISPRRDMVQTIADLKVTDPDDLMDLWPIMDDIISDIFSEPPAPEAQVEISFSYEGYRITIHQNGKAEFVRITDRG